MGGEEKKKETGKSGEGRSIFLAHKKYVTEYGYYWSNQTKG